MNGNVKMVGSEVKGLISVIIILPRLGALRKYLCKQSASGSTHAEYFKDFSLLGNVIPVCSNNTLWN